VKFRENPYHPVEEIPPIGGARGLIPDLAEGPGRGYRTENQYVTIAVSNVLRS
jgi:hypothetical protein